MLVLTRKQREQIQIGEDITITILRVKGNAVRIGIEAPQGIRVLRGELVDAVTHGPAGNGLEMTVAEAAHAASDVAPPRAKSAAAPVFATNPSTAVVLTRMLSSC